MILRILSSLALKTVVRGVFSALTGGKGQGGDDADDLIDPDDIVKFLCGRFFDQSQRLSEALKKSNDQAWKATARRTRPSASSCGPSSRPTRWSTRAAATT
jgi:hypothetical protein